MYTTIRWIFVDYPDWITLIFNRYRWRLCTKPGGAWYIFGHSEYPYIKFLAMRSFYWSIFFSMLSAYTLPAQSPAIKALVGGALIDGYGGRPIHNSVILIEGERIKAVGHQGNLPVPEGAEIISTEGMSVLPGLWDAHVHLMINGHSDYAHWDTAYLHLLEEVIMPASALQLLLAGVTSARELGAPLEASIAVRDRIRRGEIPGPTIYVSGPFIQHEPYPGTEAFRWGVKGAADARAKVKKLAQAGVDIIKLIDHDEMTMDELRAVVEEAHAHGLPVVAHAHRPEEIRRGLEVGVDCFEHTGLSSAPEYPEDIIALIKERTARMNVGPLYWTPTVEGLYNYEYLRDNPERLDDDCWHLGLPDSIIADIRQSIRYPGRLPYFQLTPLRKPTLERKVKQLIDAGVVLLIGTDSGIPMKFHCQSTWNELDVWVNGFGIDPMYAIRAATYWPAKAMGVEKDYGTISEGKYADIIAVKGDVLRYINLLHRVDIVVKHGKRVR
jgi:imidazolonepropionase-like amidohydrolase